MLKVKNIVWTLFFFFFLHYFHFSLYFCKCYLCGIASPSGSVSWGHRKGSRYWNRWLSRLIRFGWKSMLSSASHIPNWRKKMAYLKLRRINNKKGSPLRAWLLTLKPNIMKNVSVITTGEITITLLYIIHYPLVE